MDAPLYPPATAFEKPHRLPQRISTKDTAVADIQANPQAWAMVLKVIPNIEAMIGSPMLRPHLGNFSFRSLIQFGIVKADVLDRIDEEFKTLDAIR